jgi:tol-pal system-associated acyl-CoA thioesterase
MRISVAMAVCRLNRMRYLCERLSRYDHHCCGAVAANAELGQPCFGADGGVSDLSVAAFSWPVRVYIEDTDAGGIVYYVNYLKFMERARCESLRSLGFGKTWIFECEHMFVVQRMNVDYIRPALLDDELRVTASVVAAGRAWLEFEQQVYRAQELLCTAQVKVVCVNKATMKPTAIPRAMREALH